MTCYRIQTTSLLHVDATEQIYKVILKDAPPQARAALFTVFAGTRNTGELTDFIKTAEKLSQDKSYSFNTNVYRQNRLYLM